jgi:hypothetical protein
MNKLTEIKQDYEFKMKYQKDYGIILTPLEKKSLDDLGYLLSLLEEKNKALAFYADEKNYKQEMGYHDLDNKSDFYFEPPAVMDDSGNIARKALNTSSNNEGEIQP